MILTPGEKLGPYEILAMIGKGGMGEVYRARDPRVGRDVAIKVSGQRFTERFEREARVIASLNHPNICALYDVGPNYLVMELIEGEPPRGPMPLEDALAVARQIADALDYAHEKGVVHRDLKPANIKLTPEGGVKVLDFGLAKQLPDREGTAAEDSPTLSMGATQAGVILGTAGYMSPEQARGKRAGRGADIWAFGVILYELLRGTRLFKGDDVSETMAAVIKEEPSLDQVPREVRRLLQRCLEKDPRKRLRDIGDVWQLLDQPAAPSGAGTRSSKTTWAATTALLLAGLGVALWAPWRAPSAALQSIRFQIYPPEGTTFSGAVDQPPVVSPDGKRVAFYAMGQDGRTRVWTRNLDSLDAHRLDGTEEAGNITWSPDGRWIAFRSGPELKKILSTGGPVQSLCSCLMILPAAWSKEGVILFGNSSGLMKVSENGGAAKQVTSVDPARGELIHLLPSFLPDGRHFLYSRISSMQDKAGSYAGSLDNKLEQQPLDKISEPLATYDAGRLVFSRGTTLATQLFDAGKLTVSGEASEIAAAAATVIPPASGNGVLAYGGVGNPLQLTWFDRQGKAVGTIGAPGPVWNPRIAPDNVTVAFNRQDVGPGDIWLYEPKRGAYQFTFADDRENAVWSPDGSHIAYSALIGGGWSLVQRATNGVGGEEVLNRGDSARFPFDWSKNGKYLLFNVLDPKTKLDSWVLPVGDKKAFLYSNESYNEDAPRLSPDGRWVAYQRDQTGRFEIWVDTFTGASGAASAASRGSWPVSTNGGTRPVWSRDGKALFFIGLDRKMMVAEVTNGSGNKFEFSTPKQLFDAQISGDPTAQFDVSKDGRFLMPVQVQQRVATPITVLVNWTAALSK